MALKLFEFQKRIMIDTFLVKLPNLRKLDQNFHFTGKLTIR